MNKPYINITDEKCPYTFLGRIEDEDDAQILIDACCSGILPTLKHRLSQAQKEAIGPGYIFVYNRRESSIQRWTDSRLWTPSKIAGRFLQYFELHRRYSPIVKGKSKSNPGPKFHPEDLQDLINFQNKQSLLACPIAIRLKGLFVYNPNGLVKKTFTSQTEKGSYHLIAYEDAQGNNIASMCRPSDYEQLLSKLNPI